MRLIQVFSVPFGGGQGEWSGTLFGLDSEGAFWMLSRTGFGDDGRGRPRKVEWIRADHVIPRSEPSK